MPARCTDQAPVPPLAYHRAQVHAGPALHSDALTLISSLHLLALCRIAVGLSHRLCPPPLPAGLGGAPRRCKQASLLLMALLRVLWRLSYQGMRDWLDDWPAFALACGLPTRADGSVCVPSSSQQWKRAKRAGARSLRRSLLSWFAWPSSVASFVLAISSVILLPFSPGLGPTQMPLGAMLPPIILTELYKQTGSCCQ